MVYNPGQSQKGTGCGLKKRFGAQLANQTADFGYALLPVLIFTVVMLLFAGALATVIYREHRIVGNREQAKKAHYLAEGGIRLALIRLEEDTSWIYNEQGAVEKDRTLGAGHVSYTAGDERAKINLNAAIDCGTLQAWLAGLNDLHAGQAEEIVAYREEHGRFATLAELTEVDGIGESTYENTADRLTVYPTAIPDTEINAVNINTAGGEVLTALLLAHGAEGYDYEQWVQEILDYRIENVFTSTCQLKEETGIEPTVYNESKDWMQTDTQTIWIRSQGEIGSFRTTIYAVFALDPDPQVLHWSDIF